MAVPEPEVRTVTNANVTTAATTVENIADVQKSRNKKERKLVPDWRPIPSTDSSELLKHYSMLSKIRLTCMVLSKYRVNKIVLR